MFLKDILDHVPTEKNRYSESIRIATEAGMPVAGIWRLFAWNPALAEGLSKTVQTALRGPSPLSPGFREMIAAFVSTRNHCLF